MDWHQQYKLGESLLKAVWKNDVTGAEECLKQGAQIEWRYSNDPDTPLQFASRVGSGEMVKMLLRHDASLELSGGMTPALWDAVYNGHVEIVRILIAHGADPHWKDAEGNDVFATAARSRTPHKYAEIISALNGNALS